MNKENMAKFNKIEYVHLRELVENVIRNNKNINGLYISPVEYMRTKEKIMSKIKGKINGNFISAKTNCNISNKL